MNFSLVSSKRKVFFLAVGIMFFTLVRVSFEQFYNVSQGVFPNPDSYYKLVLLEGYANGQPINFNPRDNTPEGNWIHWSLPHSWVMWQLHKVYVFGGMDLSSALIWSGASITMLSMLLLIAFVTATVLSVGTRKAALATALILVSSLPLAGYGQLQQITHHIFMLVPLSASALCVIRSLVGKSITRDFIAGLLAGLALWISPETMPVIVILMMLRISILIQHLSSGALWPFALGLFIVTALGFLVDPPPPSFDSWTLDHVSYAWLLFSGLSALLLIFIDVLFLFRVKINLIVICICVFGGLISLFWLCFTPGALSGPSGLLPEFLRLHWWSSIQELQSVYDLEHGIAYIFVPIVSGAISLYWSLRKRLLWVFVLSTGVFLYAAMSFLYIRMGAASALVTALAFGVSAGFFRALSDAEENLRCKDNVVGIFVVLVGPLQLVMLSVIAVFSGDESVVKKEYCSLPEIASELNEIEPSGFFVYINDAPSFMYNSNHMVVTGNYHHNIEGLMDYYKAFLDKKPWADFMSVMRKRNLQYVLFCAKKGERLDDMNGSLYSVLREPQVSSNELSLVLILEKNGWLLYRNESFLKSSEE